jgi:hypothetical protein
LTKVVDENDDDDYPNAFFGRGEGDDHGGDADAEAEQLATPRYDLVYEPSDLRREDNT